MQNCLQALTCTRKYRLVIVPTMKRIIKNIYGLKEAPLSWWRHFQSTVVKFTSLRPMTHDECGFYSEDLIMLAYVDDLLLLGKREKIKHVLRALGKRFKMTKTEINAETDFLGTILRKEPNGSFTLNQIEYCRKILKQWAPDVMESPTPLPVNYEYQQRVDESDITNVRDFQMKLGCLSFLRITRLDILHSLHQLARHASSPRLFHVQCMTSLFGYLKATVERKRWFYPIMDNGHSDANKLVSLIDASFANGSNYHSTSGFFMFLNSTMINAQSTTQSKIATSAPEAELFEMVRTAKKMTYVRGLLFDMGCTKVDMVILTDSQSSVSTAHNPVSVRYRYLSVYIALLRRMVSKKMLRVVFMRRKDNFADLLTKQSSRKVFEYLLMLALSPFVWRHDSTKGN